MAGFDFSLGFGFDTDGAGYAPSEDVLLQESGGAILLEDDFDLLLE